MTTRPPLIQPRQPPRFVPSGGQGRVGSTGIDIQFGGPGQWRTYDWPLPRAPVYPNHLRTHIQNVNILLIGKDVQFGAAGQFKTYDWPLPKTPIYPPPLRTWTANAQTQLIGKDTQFGAPGQFKSYDWPLPRPYVYPNQTRTWLLNAQIQLIGQDTFFGGFGKAPTYDWPLPRVSPQGKTWTLGLNETTLVPVAANPLPFNQMDWPLPRTAPYQNALRTALDWFTFNDQDTFFGGAGQPPANMDWSLPKTAPASGKTWIYTLNQTTLLPSLQAPFSQTDWPIPRMALYSAQNRTWLDQVKLNLIGQDQFFGTQGQGPTYDWPRPKTAVRLPDYSWAISLNQTTLAPFIAPLPFNLYDWPLPRTPLPLVDLRSSTQGSGFPDQIPPPPAPVVAPEPVGGASGAKRYRQPAWWGDEKKKKLLKKVEAVQLQIEKKREQIDLAPDLFRIQRLIEQIADLQKRMMKLLEQIDELNKLAGDEEAMLIYTIYRSLH